jgi:hypothetical protein
MAKKKNNLKWIKETLELKPDHRWATDNEGYQIFVAGRGAVRIDVPKGWIFEPDEKSFRFLNADPPDDDCRLEVSFNLLPPGEWDMFPLKSTLRSVMEKDTRNVIERGEVITEKRQTARIVWMEIKFIDDQEEERDAYSRTCIGIGSNVQCLITMDYWADQAELYTPVWDVVMRSLTLGLFIRDPRTGLAFPD